MLGLEILQSGKAATKFQILDASIANSTLLNKSK